MYMQMGGGRRGHRGEDLNKTKFYFTEEIHVEGGEIYVINTLKNRGITLHLLVSGVTLSRSVEPLSL